MARYQITAIVESDEEYTDGDQIEDLRSDISMAIADYNCFFRIGDIRIQELVIIDSRGN